MSIVLTTMISNPFPTYAFRKYFQDVPTKNGSLFMVSIAQNPMGIRTQLRPAAVTVLHVSITWEGGGS